MRACIARVALVALAALPIVASAAPVELPAPGTASAALPALAHYTCEAAGQDRQCRFEPRAGALTFEGIPVVAVRIRLADERVVSGTVWFAEGRFDSATRSLTTRLGPPETRTEELRAGMGATFTNAVLVWHRPGQAAWLAEQFSGGIDTSSVTWMSAEALAGWLRARAAETVNGARNLRSGYD